MHSFWKLPLEQLAIVILIFQNRAHMRIITIRLFVHDGGTLTHKYYCEAIDRFMQTFKQNSPIEEKMIPLLSWLYYKQKRAPIWI